MRRRFLALAAAALLLLSSAPGVRAEEPRSTISILVDLSRTWHNHQSAGQNKRALDAALSAAVELAIRYRPPTQVRVLAIGDASLLRPALCDAIYDPKLINVGKSVGSAFTNEKSFRKYLKTDCLAFVLASPVENLTDISGAIDTVSRVSSHQQGKERSLIILSDMVEELGKGQVAPPLTLPGFRTVILYRALATDKKNPNLLTSRLDGWAQKLAKAGSHVDVVADETASSDQIARLLRFP